MATTGLTVAVTGPTGDLGLAIVDALERSRAVKQIIGMARRPFEPGERGWRKTEYRQGDVLDRSTVDDLVKGADVVVHLAFIVLGASDRTREINVEGSRNVFAAAVAGLEGAARHADDALHRARALERVHDRQAEVAGRPRHSDREAGRRHAGVLLYRRALGAGRGVSGGGGRARRPRRTSIRSR